jgi:hypothetical protein
MSRAALLALLLSACKSEQVLVSTTNDGLTIELHRFVGGLGNPTRTILMEHGQKSGGWDVDCDTPKARVVVQGRERRVAFHCAPYYSGWTLFYADHGKLYRAHTDIGRGPEPDWARAKPFAESPGEIAYKSMPPELQELYLDSMRALGGELGDKAVRDAIVAFRQFNGCPPCAKFEPH